MMTNWALVGTISVAGFTALIDDYRDDPSDLLTSLTHPLFEQDTLCAYILQLAMTRHHVLMGDVDEAAEAAERMRALAHQARGAITQLLGFIWSCIASCDAATASPRPRWHLRRARADRKKLDAGIVVDNSLICALATLLNAELLAARGKRGRRSEIIDTYERALEAFVALDQCYMTAVAADQYARFVAGDDAEAGSALWQRSVDAWAGCGCAAMAQRLFKRRLEG